MQAKTGMKRVKKKYNINDSHKEEKKAAEKSRYSNPKYRMNKINEFKFKYHSNVDYKKSLIEHIKIKYQTNVQFKTKLINGIK